jgi:hypothetical protein
LPEKILLTLQEFQLYMYTIFDMVLFNKWYLLRL